MFAADVGSRQWLKFVAETLGCKSAPRVVDRHDLAVAVEHCDLGEHRIEHAAIELLAFPHRRLGYERHLAPSLQLLQLTSNLCVGPLSLVRVPSDAYQAFHAG